MLGDDSMSEHYQVIVIGSGSGGKEAAILPARAGLQVLLVGKESLGGTCFIAVVTPFECSKGVRDAPWSSRRSSASGARSFLWKTVRTE
jgi:hypothetical protein